MSLGWAHNRDRPQATTDSGVAGARTPSQPFWRAPSRSRTGLAAELPGNAATSKFSAVRARSHDGRSRGRQASVREARSRLDHRSPPLASADCGPTPSIPGILALSAVRFPGWRQGARSLHARPLSTPGAASVRWPSPPAPGSPNAPAGALRLRAGPLNPCRSGAQRSQISRFAPGNAVAARPAAVDAWGGKRPLAKPSRPWVASRPPCRPAIEGRLPQSLQIWRWNAVYEAPCKLSLRNSFPGKLLLQGLLSPTHSPAMVIGIAHPPREKATNSYCKMHIRTNPFTINPQLYYAAKHSFLAFHRPSLQRH